MTGIYERFIGELSPDTRNEQSGSLYYRVTNMTKGVLVTDRNSEDTDLVRACFAAGLPVSVMSVDGDARTPRVEIGSDSILGKEEIFGYLKEAR